MCECEGLEVEELQSHIYILMHGSWIDGATSKIPSFKAKPYDLLMSVVDHYLEGIGSFMGLWPNPATPADGQ